MELTGNKNLTEIAVLKPEVLFFAVVPTLQSVRRKIIPEPSEKNSAPFCNFIIFP